MPFAETTIPLPRILASTLAALSLAAPVPAVAQDGEAPTTATWRLEELHEGFCVQFLVEPDALSDELPERTQAMTAGDVGDELPVPLRTVVAEQPEFAAWVPSRLCLYTFGLIVAGRVRAANQERRKAPMLVFWTVPIRDGAAGSSRRLALGLYANTSRLDDAADAADLELRDVRTTYGPVPVDEEAPETDAQRTTVRLGKTLLTWDGRPASDSAAVSEPEVVRWRSEGDKRPWVDGTLTLTPRVRSGMIGSLKVEGKDDLAKMMRASPIRFVGPGYRGGGGTIEVEARGKGKD